MRFPKLALAAAAAGLAAFAAAAQDADPPPEAPPVEERRSGLTDLEETVNQLLREEGEPAGAEPATEAATEEATEEAPPEEQVAEEAPVEEAVPEPVADQPAPEPAAAEPVPPAPPLTRAEIAAVERTIERGRLLVAIARAGIIATQDMLSRVSDPEGAGIDGWVAEPAGAAMDVTFYADGEDAPRAVYRASVLGGRVTSRETWLGGNGPALSPVQARMAAARAATDGLDHRACTELPFNAFVIPPARFDAPIDVYQLSSPSERGHFPLGGHFRSTVSADGTVTDSRAFTNACPEVESGPEPEGQQPRPIGLTHLLDPMPTEVHMYLSRQIGRPLLVATGEPQRIWLVTSERIAEVRP